MDEKKLENELEKELAHEREEEREYDATHPHQEHEGKKWPKIQVIPFNHVKIDLPDFSGGSVSVQLGQLTQAAGPNAGGDTIEATYLFGNDANAMLDSLMTGTGVSNMLGPNPPTPVSVQSALADPTKTFTVLPGSYLGVRLRVWESNGDAHQDFLYGFSTPPGGTGLATFARFTADPGHCVQIEGQASIYFCWRDLNSTVVPRWSHITDPVALSNLFGSGASAIQIPNDPPGMVAAVANDPGIQIDDTAALVKGSGAPVYLVAQGIKHHIATEGAFSYSGFDWSKVQTKSDEYIAGLADGPAIDWQSPTLG